MKTVESGGPNFSLFEESTLLETIRPDRSSFIYNGDYEEDSDSDSDEEYPITRKSSRFSKRGSSAEEMHKDKMKSESPVGRCMSKGELLEELKKLNF
jgi:hypothetical protein